MSSAAKCGHCGGVVRDAARAACEYCGAALEPSPRVALDARTLLAAVRKHPNYGEWLRSEPSIARHQARSALAIVVGMGVFAFAVFWMVQASRAGGAFWMLGLIFVAFAFLMVVRTLKATRRIAAAKLERVAALVVSKDLHVQRSGDSTHTVHSVTLELENGERRVTRAAPMVSAALAEGDVGLAFARDELLLDFKRTAALPRG